LGPLKVSLKYPSGGKVLTEGGGVNRKGDKARVSSGTVKQKKQALKVSWGAPVPDKKKSHVASSGRDYPTVQKGRAVRW